MRRIITAVLCGMLLLSILPPAAAANDIFALLETPEPSREPTAAMAPSNSWNIRPNTEAQDIFAALETPEPTPFPTPAPRIDPKGSVKSGDFTFELLPDKSARILAYSGKDKTLCIPSELKSYPVTSIGISAFANSASLTELEIPEGVLSIGDWAFGGCQKLARVTLPESLLTIGSFAFADCPELGRIRVPAGVVEIGEGAIARKTPGAPLTVELERGSFAERFFAACDCTISYYSVPVPSPTPSSSYASIPTPYYVSTGYYADLDDDDYNSGSNTSHSETCHVCRGNKKCTECGGTGRKAIQREGINLGNGSSTYNQYIKCPLCDGDKNCYWCHGTGYEPFS